MSCDETTQRDSDANARSPVFKELERHSPPRVVRQREKLIGQHVLRSVVEGYVALCHNRNRNHAVSTMSKRDRVLLVLVVVDSDSLL